MTNELAAAAEHDAAGRHDDAIDELSRGTQRGDLESTVALAKRLLVGDRAPWLPKEAVSFLSDALTAGSVEAALRLAPLAVSGTHVPHSWGDGLGLLVFAAERGSVEAQGQLRALAPQIGAGAQPSWREIGEGCDVTAWLAVPSSVTLSAAPVVRSVRDLATEPMCDWLKQRAHGGLRRALIYDAERGTVTDHMRSNSIVTFDLSDMDVVQAVLQLRMALSCGMPPAHAEGPTILHYSVGQQITDHTDFLNPGMDGYERLIDEQGERLITFLLYLNDDYDGGETDFPRIGVRHKGRHRGGLFFSNALPNGKPDERMVHAGLPPTRGEKWVVSQFFRSRPALNARAERVG